MIRSAALHWRHGKRSYFLSRNRYLDDGTGTGAGAAGAGTGAAGTGAVAAGTGAVAVDTDVVDRNIMNQSGNARETNVHAALKSRL